MHFASIGKTCAPAIATAIEPPSNRHRPSQAPTCGEFEEKMAKYQRMAQDLWASPKERDCHFIRVSAHPLIASARPATARPARPPPHPNLF